MAAPQASNNLLTGGGIFLSAALTMLGAFQYMDAETTRQSESRDVYKVGAQTARFAEFQTAVPQNAILGYITDVDDAQPIASAMLLSAQYTLVPRLLERGVLQDLVLGNFTHPADFVAFGQQRGLKLERDFGNGVILFKRDSAAKASGQR